MYLLVVGVLLGVLLGPAVLGNLGPDLRDRMFGADEPLSSLRDAFDAQTAAQLKQLEATGVTEVAVEEQMRARQQDWLHQVTARELVLDRRAMGLILALLAALAVVMVLEAVLSPQPDPGGRAVVYPAYRRLISARYALLALLAALVIARPSVLGVTSLPLVAIAVVLTLLGALVPLGPSRASRA